MRSDICSFTGCWEVDPCQKLGPDLGVCPHWWYCLVCHFDWSVPAPYCCVLSVIFLFLQTRRCSALTFVMVQSKGKRCVFVCFGLFSSYSSSHTFVPWCTCDVWILAFSDPGWGKEHSGGEDGDVSSRKAENSRGGELRYDDRRRLKQFIVTANFTDYYNSYSS